MEYHNEPYHQAELVLRYLRKETNETESREIEDWLAENPENRTFMERLQSEQGLAEELQFFDDNGKGEAWASIQRNTRQRRSSWPRIAAAASILICLSLGGYFLLHKHPAQQVAQNKIYDIAPGGNKAILTLFNGQKVSLTDAKNGNIAQQSGTQIKKAQNGQVVYLATNGGKATEVTYNTISTPRGGKWQLTLSDGSRVWLNAASSITFPTAFTGKNRIVKLSGEALFEVVHNAKAPFKVQTEKQMIEDVGTTFDVNAYSDELVTETTLIEGKVKVNNMFLEPGQQSDGIHVKTVDPQKYTAWASDDFYFENDNIQTIMRQLSRWYNIQVSYEGNITTNIFTAQISRAKNISAVLHILENTKGVHFKIEGRRLTVIQ